MPIIRLENLEQFAAVNVLLDPGAIGGPVVIPSCAQVVINWALEDGKTGHNVLYGRYAGAFVGTPAVAESIRAALVAGSGWSTLAGFLATTTSLTSVTIRDVNTANNPIITSTGTAAPGTAAGTTLPNEVAAVITLRTARTGPQNRGRIYVPGWATNALATGNVIAPAAVTALGTWGLNNISSAMGAGGYTWVIGQKARASYTGSTGTLHPARAAGSVQVTSAVVRDNRWDTQRRRGLK